MTPASEGEALRAVFFRLSCEYMFTRCSIPQAVVQAEDCWFFVWRPRRAPQCMRGRVPKAWYMLGVRFVRHSRRGQATPRHPRRLSAIRRGGLPLPMHAVLTTDTTMLQGTGQSTHGSLCDPCYPLGRHLPAIDRRRRVVTPVWERSSSLVIGHWELVISGRACWVTARSDQVLA